MPYESPVVDITLFGIEPLSASGGNDCFAQTSEQPL